MFDSERKITLMQLAKELLPTWPPAENGEPMREMPLYQKILRFAADGSCGVMLEAAKFGNRWVTSREAWERFTAACTQRGRKSAEPVVPPPMTERQMEAHRTKSRARAKQLGIL